MIVHYKSPDQAKLPHGAAEQKYHVGLKLDVTQGPHKVFDGRADTEGRFAFTALQGEHHLCWRCALPLPPNPSPSPRFSRTNEPKAHSVKVSSLASNPTELLLLLLLLRSLCMDGHWGVESLFGIII